MNDIRILPPGSQFSAVVDGKPTGLAGCERTGECPRAASCLRADARLTYRADLAPHQPVTACRAFIPARAVLA